MKKSLDQKLASILKNPSHCKDFIIADAKDPDMAFGISATGKRLGSSSYRLLEEFLEEIRKVVRQGIVDIMLASTSVMERLAHEEKLFAKSTVTPAIRANDTTDIWLPRGATYRQHPSRPFASSLIEHAQYGSLKPSKNRMPVVNLGLYSTTFNNDLDADYRSLEAFKDFRIEAEQKGFHYFWEVFAPNVECGLKADEIPGFVNDHVLRTLAAVPRSARPKFLKIPYLGPQAMEDLASYDPTLVVGILGGGAGTTYDAFKLIADAQKHGARVALFGRKIKEAEDPLTFIVMLRTIVEGKITPEAAVKKYHGQLEKQKIKPIRNLKDDMQITDTALHY